VEFIVGADGAFYFMEINTRLQVEHPVTEMVTGLDLVEWQLRVANGESLPLAQDQIEQIGHAIEVRLYAEDPEKNFLPGSGKLERLHLPQAGGGVRIDAGVETGDTVSVFYDPMIAKLIVHANDRRAALAKLARALGRCDIVGPASNIAFLERLIAHPKVVEGTIDTGYLDRHLDEIFAGIDAAPSPAAIAAALATRLRGESDAARNQAAAGNDPHSPWANADGWRVGHASARPLWLEVRGQRLELPVTGDAQAFAFEHDGRRHDVQVRAHATDSVTLQLDGGMHRLPVLRSGDDVIVHDGTVRHRFHPARVYGFEGAADRATDTLRAPMPGRIVAVNVGAGDAVEAQQPLLVMEAMKMELTLRAPVAATISELLATVGEFVEADTVLVRFGENPA
jgi:3-methylcrotonyl-CoA carboxylase alpha subunit